MAFWRHRGDTRVLETRLENIHPVAIRPLVPSDAEALLDGWRSLSDESRLFRFLRDKPPPALEQARGLTEGDTGSDLALGAALVEDGAQAPAGVARYFTVGPNVAEMAITVVDHTQSRGLGMLLLGLLADVARDRGIQRFVGLVHGRNTAMLHVLNSLGAALVSRRDAAREFVLPLCDDPKDYPATRAGDVFRQAHSLRRRWE